MAPLPHAISLEMAAPRPMTPNPSTRPSTALRTRSLTSTVHPHSSSLYSSSPGASGSSSVEGSAKSPRVRSVEMDASSLSGGGSERRMMQLKGDENGTRGRSIATCTSTDGSTGTAEVENDKSVLNGSTMGDGGRRKRIAGERIVPSPPTTLPRLPRSHPSATPASAKAHSNGTHRSKSKTRCCPEPKGATFSNRCGSGTTMCLNTGVGEVGIGTERSAGETLVELRDGRLEVEEETIHSEGNENESLYDISMPSPTHIVSPFSTAPPSPYSASSSHRGSSPRSINKNDTKSREVSTSPSRASLSSISASTNSNPSYVSSSKARGRPLSTTTAVLRDPIVSPSRLATPPSIVLPAGAANILKGSERKMRSRSSSRSQAFDSIAQKEAKHDQATRPPLLSYTSFEHSFDLLPPPPSPPPSPKVEHKSWWGI